VTSLYLLGMRTDDALKLMWIRETGPNTLSYMKPCNDVQLICHQLASLTNKLQTSLKTRRYSGTVVHDKQLLDAVW